MDELDTAWRAGQEAWPGVDLDREAFAGYCAKLDAGAVERYPSDLYLVAACLAGSDAALAAFDRDVLNAARGAIRAIDSDAAFVDEGVQQLRSTLFVGDGAPRLAMYAGRGPLRAWVGIAAARTALMMRRTRMRAREVPVGDDDWTAAIATITTNNPELELLKRQYAEAFSAALRESVTALEPRLNAALRMSFVDGLSIDEIAAVYAVHRATAARWIQRACDTVFEASRKLLTERLSLTPTELDRMTSLVRSQLDVSLSQLLPPSEMSNRVAGTTPPE